MAERRMFAKTIIDSDAFLDMPLSTQALYFHLSMRGDDEGFVNNPKKIARMLGSGDDELKVLVAKKFIILFDSGVIVIKHWKLHNYIRGDRIKETNYTDERDMLITNENGSYSMIDADVSQMSVKCQSNVSVGEDSIDKVSIVDNRDITSGKPSSLFLSIDVISYLNSKAGTNYRQHIKKTISLIKARQDEGFTLNDFKTVIDKQCLLWKSDPKMCGYLRPETLFGTKFEGYLNATISPKNQSVSRHNAEVMQSGLNQLGYSDVFEAYEDMK